MSQDKPSDKLEFACAIMELFLIAFIVVFILQVRQELNLHGHCCRQIWNLIPSAAWILTFFLDTDIHENLFRLRVTGGTRTRAFHFHRVTT